MKAKCLVSAIALSFFLVGCGTTKEATYRLVSLSMAPTLVVLGDSVSAGVYVPSNDVYPRLLADDLHAQLTVYAVPGHTTAETHSMYIGELAPTYAVIELGTNDYNHGVPLATFAADYESVVESISPARKRSAYPYGILAMLTTPVGHLPWASHHESIEWEFLPPCITT